MTCHKNRVNSWTIIWSKGTLEQKKILGASMNKRLHSDIRDVLLGFFKEILGISPK